MCILEELAYLFTDGEQVALEVDELGLTVDEGVRLLKERDDSDSHGASFCRVARILDLRPAYRTRPATEPETGMTDHDPGTITLEMMRANLYTAVFSDVLDELGYREQSPRVDLPPWSGPGVLVGRAKTTLWATLDREEERPYELELRAVDECRPDDVFIAAAGGTMVSGVWGELLSTAASSRRTQTPTSTGYPAPSGGTPRARCSSSVWTSPGRATAYPWTRPMAAAASAGSA